jgi:pyrroline-5-carboxylate reductase
VSEPAPPTRLWLAGAGNMGGAMLRRWVASGAVSPANVTVIDPGAPVVPDGVQVVGEAPDGPPPDIVVLAVKPQMIDAVLPSLRRDGAARGPAMLVSILAGVDLATLRDRFAADAIVRAMPNLPVGIGKGVVALCADDAAVRAAADALMTPLGLVEWVDEALFDAVTALSGSGPGFTYRFIDALAKAGAALGLPADQALRLARATVEGSAILAAEADEPPATLADRVASRGGSTREGLNVLDRDDAIVRLLTETLAAATRRNAEMAAEARR